MSVQGDSARDNGCRGRVETLIPGIDLGIVMNEIAKRELDRYIHAGRLIPGNPICTAPVFLVCIPRNKGSQKIKESKQCLVEISISIRQPQ
jgi:hypothetical protein